MLRKHPGVTLIALLTLALGIGANSAIFSIVDGVMLKPSPYPYADRIVEFRERRPTGQPNALSTLNYLDYANQSTVFEGVAASTGCCGAITLTSGSSPLALNPNRVSAAYFDILGIPPALGRAFTAGDDTPGRDHVVVLSHKFWASRFGSDVTLIGQSIRLDGEPYTVIGVMPADSPFDRSPFSQTAIWLPLSFTADRMNRSSHWIINGVALLKPGVTMERAQRDLDGIAARLAIDYPASNKDWGASVTPHDEVRSDLRLSLYLLFAAAGMVLLIGCVNLANLMLARGMERDHEIAVRLAIGAGRSRLIRQFAIESVLLSLGGGLLGLVAGYGAMAALRAALIAMPLNPSMPAMLLPAEAVIGFDTRVVIFTFLVSVFCAVAFGLVPALRATTSVTGRFIGLDRSATTTVSHRRFRNGLIVAEVALAFVLLTSAGLLLRSLVNMQSADTGFDATNVLTAELPFRRNQFQTAEQLHAFMREVIAKVGALRGVRDVAFTEGRPLQGVPTGTFFQVARRPIADRSLRPLADFKVVTPGYFRALGLRLNKGRALSDADRDGAPPAVVINETLAGMYFRGEEPLGQFLLMQPRQFAMAGSGPEIPWEIVGVIADERMTPFDDKRTHPVVYVTNEQSPSLFSTGLVIRAAVDPSAMENALRMIIAAIDKDQPVMDVKTVEVLASESMMPARLRSVLLGLFAALALVLSAIGIYGVISYSVVQRTREIGIRSALGADAVSLKKLILGGGLSLTAMGLVFGSIAAAGATRLLRAFLFGVESSDPATSIAAAIVLAIVGAAACYIPARRAAHLDPLEALRRS